MNGKDRSITASCVVLILIAFVGLSQAENTKHKGESFRFGITADPGFKPVEGPEGQINLGLVFKFHEKLSLIPQVGYFPYKKEEIYYENDEKKTTREWDSEPNIMLTARWEFTSEVIDTTTRFRYNVAKRKFEPTYHYAPFRPYVQLHLGPFMGAGAGILYYFKPYMALGTGFDVGVNLIAGDDELTDGLGVMAPRLVIVLAF